MVAFAPARCAPRKLTSCTARPVSRRSVCPSLTTNSIPSDRLGYLFVLKMNEDAEWRKLVEGLAAGDDEAYTVFWQKFGARLSRVAENRFPPGLQRRIGAEDVGLSHLLSAGNRGPTRVDRRDQLVATPVRHHRE